MSDSAPRIGWYAPDPAARARQRWVDLAVAALVLGLLLVAGNLHRSIDRMAVPGSVIADAGARLAGVGDVADRIGRLPVVGDLAAPFAAVGEAGDVLVQAGDDSVAAVTDLAFWVPSVVGVLPTAMLLGWHVPRRRRWRRDAIGALHLATTPSGRDVLAARAVASLPLDLVAERPAESHADLVLEHLGLLAPTAPASG